MGKTFRAYDPKQKLLLPPDLRDWLKEGHLADYVSDVVDQLDLSEIFKVYDEGEQRGQPPYNPLMMTKLLIYGYSTGRMSSRKLEQACYEDVAFRVLSCDQQPDHASIAGFRKRHLQALSKLFVQVLKMCEKAGLVKLGRVAIDGTKIKANAAKRRTHSYQQLCQWEQEMAAEVERLMSEAKALDEQEDRQHGGDRRGDELPEELRDRKRRLALLRQAKEDLEREAVEMAEAAKEEKAKQKAHQEAGEVVAVLHRKKKWKNGPNGEVVPEADRKRNLTDLDSRLLKDTATKTWIQGYNPQIAVDGHAQIIVASHVTQAANDVEQLVPMLLLVKENLERMPEQVLADSGYFSPVALSDERLQGIDLYVLPNKPPKGESAETEAGEPEPAGDPPTTANAAIRAAMTEKLDQPGAMEIYKTRNQIAEPPFATTKHVRGFRQFLLRGNENVNGEWSLVCMTHNLLKLFRAQLAPSPA